MTRLFFLGLLVTLTFSGLTQIVGNRVDKYIAQNSIDTFMVYSLPCSGGFSFDSCQYEESHYLIWRQDEKFFLKRFDYGKTYRVLSLHSPNPLTYYMNNKRIIDKEQIHQPTYYQVKKNKTTIDTLMITTAVDHSCYHTFRLPLAKKPKYKSADVYDLDFKTFDNGRKNIYYNYNQRTKFKGLIDLTTKLIKQLEADNKFEGE